MKTDLKSKLMESFQMKDLGEARFILGMQVQRDRGNGTISIDQEQYIKEILQRFGMMDSNPVSTPVDLNQIISKEMCPKNAEKTAEMKNVPYQEAIGCIMFAAQVTRPDLSFPVSCLSRYNQNPGKSHWNAIKRIFRYLKGTINTKLVFNKNSSNNLLGYCDADWASDTDERLSTTGYVFKLQGAAISWSTKRQPTVALSTTEAEYMYVISDPRSFVVTTSLR
ncbi:uncharacterized protein LOC129918242 [Episyrphus balteatus]|uniref:uncharacterized protein LOC129918242 n=1 Tax=Episyrphus balteatus TaxID=286459 RepID=UPI0024864E5C|nr:uncharacterized protein LOC129918242 [Episyrphus balteatus]